MTVTPRGLEDVVAAESAISSIIGTTLTYRGIKIEELADHASFEETVYLLWYGALPTAASCAPSPPRSGRTWICPPR